MRDSTSQQRVLSSSQVWLISWLLVAVGLLGLAGSKPWEQTPAPVGLPLTLASAPAVEAESFRGTPIEEIRVGQRVLADNPDVDTENRTQVDPTTWRKLTLQTVMVWDDGTRDEVNVQTLQPPAWVQDHQAEVGAEVLIPMDLVEIGLPEDLRAQVMANEPCPVIRPGVGRVVLTTVDHLNPDVWELDVLDANGRQTTIRPTGFHKIRSFTRQDWVSTKELHEGELIDARGSPLTVLALRRLPGVHRVYNMTVEGEHVYYVSQLAALVHNAHCYRKKPVNLPSAKKVTIDIDHIASGHMKGGSRVSSKKSLFPESWSRRDVVRAVTDAYRSAKRIRTQGDRVLARGTSGGRTIELWINRITKRVETAYPIGP